MPLGWHRLANQHLFHINGVGPCLNQEAVGGLPGLPQALLPLIHTTCDGVKSMKGPAREGMLFVRPPDEGHATRASARWPRWHQHTTATNKQHNNKCNSVQPPAPTKGDQEVELVEQIWPNKMAALWSC